MQHYWSIDGVQLKDAWLTIGSFDGVHRGHQAIIRKLIAGAHAAGAPAVVLAFHPHPSVILRNRSCACYLTTPEERAALLGELGVDVVITQPFSRQLADTPAREFVQSLVKHLQLRHLCLGHDFALGREREGDFPSLQRLGKEFGFTLNAMRPIKASGLVVSSSRIRSALEEGDLQMANQFLGRPYQVRGEVIHGDGRGHLLGIPTANLYVWVERALPKTGVYACLVGVDGIDWKAVANVGVRPTFDNQPLSPRVEVHLLDFERDLYGCQVSLSFITRLRDEQRFPSPEALVSRVRCDIEQARRILQVK